MKRIIPVTLAILVVAVATGGWYWQTQLRSSESMPADEAASHAKVINGGVQDDSSRTVLYWHDPMVPGHKFDKPGKSPFMDMQLVPQYADEGEGAAVSIPHQLEQNLGIRLVRVETIEFGAVSSSVGRVEVDEHRVFSVQTRSSGFVERLYVRAVGDPVRAGQKLAEVYAPELLGAQQEFLALTRLKNIREVEGLEQAAMTRLRLLGMREGEVAALRRSGQASPRVGIYAPSAGVVTELNVREGGQTLPGTDLMRVADLSTVWLIAELPERDVARIKPGDPAEANFESLPGTILRGRVAYLYPTLDERSRTVRVRIELPNGRGQLRTGMFARVQLAGEGRRVLAVPTESVIATGTRKIVIIKEGETFRPAEVETGMEQDSKTEIIRGLAADETVVASGQFLIDSEASLRGVLARLSLPQDDSARAAKADDEGPGFHPSARAKVVAVDLDAGRITLAHEPIPALNWPAMTMDFMVRDAQQIAAVKAGDTVRFELDPQPQADAYWIERITIDGKQP